MESLPCPNGTELQYFIYYYIQNTLNNGLKQFLSQSLTEWSFCGVWERTQRNFSIIQIILVLQSGMTYERSTFPIKIWTAWLVVKTCAETATFFYELISACQILWKYIISSFKFRSFILEWFAWYEDLLLTHNLRKNWRILVFLKSLRKKRKARKKKNGEKPAGFDLSSTSSFLWCVEHHKGDIRKITIKNLYEYFASFYIIMGHRYNGKPTGHLVKALF